MIIEDRRYLVTVKKSNGETGELSMSGLYLKLTLKDGSCEIISWKEAK